MFASALAFPAASAPTIAVGDLVSNFGQSARVVEIRPSGDLVLRKLGGRTKWIADPAKCERGY